VYAILLLRKKVIAGLERYGSFIKFIEMLIVYVNFMPLCSTNFVKPFSLPPGPTGYRLVQLERLANSLLELAILMQVLCWALGSCCSRSIDALLSFGNYAVILLCSIYTCPHFTNFCYARMILIFIFKVFQRCLYFSN